MPAKLIHRHLPTTHECRRPTGKVCPGDQGETGLHRTECDDLRRVGKQRGTAMIDTRHTPSELHAGGATVKLQCDGLACRLEVHSGDGTTAARSAALLVRQAVLDSARTGTRSMAMTLDVSSPACGAVLAQLHDLAGAGACTLQLRRAGATVLVDVDLRSTPTNAGPLPTALATQRTTARPDEECQVAGTPTALRGHHPAPTLGTARRAQRRLRSQLVGRSGVCGVGLARKDEGYALRVNVVDANVDVPAEVDGLPVDVCVTGPVNALPGRS